MAFGSITGPIYPLGKIVVATPGTPVPLSQNVSLVAPSGTATSNAPVTFNQLIITTPSGNTGLTYLVFNPGNKNSTNGTAVIVAIPPSSLFVLADTQMRQWASANQISLDADTASNSAYVTAIIV